MEGSEKSEDRPPMLDKAAVMVAVSHKDEFRKLLKASNDMKLNENTRVGIIPAVILAIAAFMAIFGRVMGSTVVLRLAGMGIPAFAHIAAALALAISNNWSLSEKSIRYTQLINTTKPDFNFNFLYISCIKIYIHKPISLFLD